MVLDLLLKLFWKVSKKSDQYLWRPTPTAFQFCRMLPFFVRDFHPEEYDLILTVDAATQGQTGFAESKPELFFWEISTRKH